jgi:sulfur-carrier protein adenylyltransferase/sulfurtransferase
MIHQLHPGLLRKAVRVLVVGCGGNGSAIAAGLPYLHQAMLVGGHPYGLEVTIMDGDVISTTNCVRQPFSQVEVGHFKSVVLVSRMNLFWGLNWRAIPQHLTENSAIDRPDIVIGCVDSRTARSVLHLKVTGHQSDTTYYVDLGNHATGGQFVLGQPWNWRNRRGATRLRTIGELFPELIDPALDDDGQPSCSALAALEKQEPFVNQTLANHALGLLARLFRYGAIEHHGAFVNLESNRVQPLAIDPEAWKRLRHRGRRLSQLAA